jgi:ketosteroid isomerase-like protein
MTMVATRQTAEDEIRGLLATWVNATRAKDIDAIMAYLAPDALVFDCHGPLRFEGADAYRKHLEACLPCMQGPMTLELHDLDVTAQGDAGFCHYLALCGGTGPDGTVQRSWFRGTACFRRIGGTWKIVHEHLSAPFDPQSGKTSLDLEP